MSPSVFETTTEANLAQFERGEIPWRKPWTTNGPPRNLISRRPYRGINTLVLASKGFASPFWLTEGALDRLGGKLKDGEIPTPVFLWRWMLKENRLCPRSGFTAR